MNGKLWRLAPYLTLVGSMAASAVEPKEVLFGPVVSENGSYTIIWDTDTSGECQPSFPSGWVTLSENGQIIDGFLPCTGSKQFDGQPVGTYEYEVRSCFYSELTGTLCFGPEIGWQSHTVVVTGAGEIGSGNVRFGDAQGNSLTDLFVEPDAGAPFLLRQQTGHTFELVTGLSAQQVSTYSSWPLAPVWTIYNDFNVNGHMDVKLYGVSNVIPNAHDILVYTNAAGEWAPQSLRSFDEQVKRFVTDAHLASMNPDYFVDRALHEGWYDEVTQTFYGLWVIADLLGQITLNGQPIADDPFDSSSVPLICFFVSPFGLPAPCTFDSNLGWVFVGFLTITFNVIDYSNFSPEGLQLVDVGDDVSDGIAPPRALVDLMEALLGPISCAGTPSIEGVIYRDPQDGIPDDYYRDQWCAHLVIGRLINASLGQGENNSGPSYEVPHSSVEIRSRWVADLGWMRSGYRHLSVHFPVGEGALVFDEWIGAFPRISVDAVYGFPTELVACDNDDTGKAGCGGFSSDSKANTVRSAILEKSGTTAQAL